MDVMDGYEFYKKILKNPEYKEIPIIFLTAKMNLKDKLYGLSFGAVDYISKPFNIKELMAKINSLIKNRNAHIEYIKESINKYLYDFKTYGNNSMNYQKLDNKIKEFKISDKEKEVLLLILKNLEYKEISKILNVSINTIRTHVKNIYDKCSVNSKYSLMNIFK
jgi:DNA-binding NarL/FixJ family response regulator